MVFKAKTLVTVLRRDARVFAMNMCTNDLFIKEQKDLFLYKRSHQVGTTLIFVSPDLPFLCYSAALPLLRWIGLELSAQIPNFGAGVKD